MGKQEADETDNKDEQYGEGGGKVSRLRPGQQLAIFVSFNSRVVTVAGYEDSSPPRAISWLL